MTLRLTDEGTFETTQTQNRSGLSRTERSLAWLDGNRFLQIRNSPDGHSRTYYTFRTDQFHRSSVNALGTKTLASTLGQAAWIQRGQESQQVTRRIKIDTNSKKGL